MSYKHFAYDIVISFISHKNSMRSVVGILTAPSDAHVLVPGVCDCVCHMARGGKAADQMALRCRGSCITWWAQGHHRALLLSGRGRPGLGDAGRKRLSWPLPALKMDGVGDGRVSGTSRRWKSKGPVLPQSLRKECRLLAHQPWPATSFGFLTSRP